MRKIVLYIASSLDGYIARKDGDVSWLPTDGDYGFTPFTARIDALVMGRKTYEIAQILGYPTEHKGYVFSKTLTGSDDKITYVNESVGEFVRTLQQQPGKDIWLMGGGELVREFLNEDLIDEVIVAIVPVLLGDGIPLVAPGAVTRKLQLTNVQKFENGSVILLYEKK